MSEKEPKKRLDKRGLERLLGIFKYILPHRWMFGAGIVLLFISSGMFMAFPFVSGKLIDIASGKEEWFIKDIDQAALLLIVVLLFQSAFSFLRVVLFAFVTEKAIADIRTELYAKMVMLPMTFFDKTRTGELVSRMTNDVSLLQTTISTTLAELIRQTVILITGLILIFYTAPALSFFMLAIFPLVIVAAMIFGRFIRKNAKLTQDQLAASNVIVEETLQSIQAVKAFTSEIIEILRFKKSIDQVVKTALSVAKYRAAFISFIIFALFGTIVAIMWYGATLVKAGEMTVGELLSFILYTSFIGASIAGLGDLIGQVQKAVGSSERVLDILQEKSEDLANGNFERLKGVVSFENVSFSYPTRPEIEVLSNVNFNVGEGEKIAIVGHSGAGKSTILQLLMDYYPKNGGKIRIDGKDQESIGLHSLRRNIGIVPQEVLLFGGTIEENIRYGKPEASDEEIKSAALKANALSFIEIFPEGMKTLVGERGVKLSGGQRQRIAIARAILKDPAILVLDEATSSLDAESEHLVQEALNILMKNRTTIVIAHRLATIKSVDKIYVLEKGRVVEEGNHEVLMKANGAYRSFIDLQLIGS